MGREERNVKEESENKREGCDGQGEEPGKRWRGMVERGWMGKNRWTKEGEISGRHEVWSIAFISAGTSAEVTANFTQQFLSFSFWPGIGMLTLCLISRVSSGGFSSFPVRTSWTLVKCICLCVRVWDGPRLLGNVFHFESYLYLGNIH